MKYLKAVLATSVILSSISVNAALLERLGGLAYYDDVADLTWLTDANYAMTSGYDADGKMNWADANTWAASLDIDGVAGADGWRLAISDVSCSDYNCTGSEMGNLFYNVLGNSAGSLTNTGPFSNVQSLYWSATEYAPITENAWYFDMFSGRQTIRWKGDTVYAWAVQSGDIGASIVPIPTAVWLFGSGLIGLIGIARRKKS